MKISEEFSVKESYTVTPTLAGYNLTPALRGVTITGADVTAINFTATVITYTISGNAGIANVTINLFGAANRTTTSGADGSYSFTGLANGSYTVTPTMGGNTFIPTSRSVTIVGADIMVQVFTTAYIGFTINGNAGFSGATITLSGAANRTAISAADGSYSFAGLANGSYAVTPTLAGYTFTPVSRSLTVAGTDITVSVFTPAYVGFTLSGNAGVVGATIALSGAADRTITSSLDGSYAFSGLSNGSYTVTPSKAGDSFTPVSRSVTVSNADVTAVNFTTTSITYLLNVTITGSGSVSINPPGTDCTSGYCQNIYAPSTPVNLTAAFNNLTLFTWSGACDGSSTLCALTMDGNKDVTATFTAAPKVKVGAMKFTDLQNSGNVTSRLNGSSLPECGIRSTIWISASTGSSSGMSLLQCSLM